ncbi:MAG: hypothetical protein R3D59_09895 [Paracoccaceae bacterium]
MALIHDRLPLVIEQDDWGLWLGEKGHGAAVLMKAAGDAVLTLRAPGLDRGEFESRRGARA